MPAPPPRRRAGRSVAAIAAGFATTAALSVATDLALHATGIYPPWGVVMSDGLFVLATAYRLVYTVLGGWIVAALAPARPLRHAWILGCIGTFFALLGLVAALRAGPRLGPTWYPLALVVTAFPSVVGGAWLRARRRAPSLAARTHPQ